MVFEKFEEEKINIQEKYGCYIDVERAYSVISSALEESRFDWNGFFNQKEQAEEEYIDFLKERGENNEFILNALFLLTTVTFGSSSKVFFDNLPKNSEQYAKHRW